MVSILDRLIDQEPAGLPAPQVEPSRDLAQIKASVKRDLEWLLNSKQPVFDPPGDLRHVRRSLLTFGLPDFTVASLNSTKDQDVLRRAIEEAVRRFEPRLADVTVRLEAGREFDRSLRFRIDGMLQVEPGARARHLRLGAATEHPRLRRPGRVSMIDELLTYYNSELAFLREAGRRVRREVPAGWPPGS